MTLKLKVCGMREADNIQSVGELQPDFIGFIFYKGSPRYVTEDFKLPSDLPSSIKKVGVFVNQAFEEIMELINKHSLNVAQLHGGEPPMVCEQLKREGIEVIKVFSVDSNFDFRSTAPYSAMVDFFLFDTKGKYHGGNGQVFDWDILNRYDQQLPFFLSGGISADNVHQVSRLKEMNLYALDVNSGVEISPGLKDINRLKVLQSEMLKAGI